jgi:hypothetical protein
VKQKGEIMSEFEDHIHCVLCDHCFMDSDPPEIIAGGSFRCPRCQVDHIIEPFEAVQKIVTEFQSSKDFSLLESPVIARRFFELWGWPESFPITPGDYFSAVAYSGIKDRTGQSAAIIVAWRKNQMLTRQDVARVLAVPPSWVDRMIARQCFTGQKQIGNTQSPDTKGNWLIPLGDYSFGLAHYLHLAEEGELVGAAGNDEWLAQGNAAMEKLVDALVDVTHHLGDPLHRGLSFPSISLDMQIIHNTRMGHIEGLPSWDDQEATISIPEIVCDIRWYLIVDDYPDYDDEYPMLPTPLAFFSGELDPHEVISMTMNTLLQGGYEDAELWLLINGKGHAFPIDYDDLQTAAAESLPRFFAELDEIMGLNSLFTGRHHDDGLFDDDEDDLFGDDDFDDG